MKKAFTLIELLLVISIISILTSVALSSLSQSKEKANLAAIAMEAKETEKAIELYRAHNDGKYPHENIVATSEMTYYRIDSTGIISKSQEDFNLESGTTSLKRFISTFKRPDSAPYFGYGAGGSLYYPTCKGNSAIPKFIIFFMLEVSENNNYPEVEYRDYNGNVAPVTSIICNGKRRMTPPDTSGTGTNTTNTEYGCYAICYY